MQVNKFLDLNSYITKDAKLLSSYRLIPIEYLARVRALMKSKGYTSKDYEKPIKGADGYKKPKYKDWEKQ